MRKFETDVQKLKYDILVQVIKAFDNNKLSSIYHDIPKIVSPGPAPTMRCCVFKERAIVQERIKLIMGGNEQKKHVIQMIDIACDECPVGGIFVTPSCRGCLSHRCRDVCPRGAITIVERKAVIDKNKCIECGLCVKTCPYHAIVNQVRPCVESCGAKAINMTNLRKATIDDEKCIACGNCVYRCPFGACVDRSFIIDAIKILNNKQNNVYAIVAPSIVGQFDYIDVEQLITGIKQLGFKRVIEVALGADSILQDEANEWLKKKILTSSCCPSFKFFVHKNFPTLAKYISQSDSPMVATGKLIKQKEPKAKVIFIGPCASKKTEFQLPHAKPYIDCVISFEELQALFDARQIHLHGIKPTKLNDASFYGRIFAKSGGILAGVKNLVEQYDNKNFHGIAMNGIKECDKWMRALLTNKLIQNFFEGMACRGGCLNGPLGLKHNDQMLANIDAFGERAEQNDPNISVNKFDKSWNKPQK
ncbi:MAG: monomeric [FeFe] hydrogenase [Mycoplasmataceae bacterium]|nr:monomeric [FeFe] hydrogenase [Mycoplasmataceae bacterium]